MKQKIIGLVGFIGSGKGTVSTYLVDKHNFRSVSFAGHLKDAISAVFGWPRSLLEGDTAYSRQWREEIDTWWAKRLNIPHLTPRWVMQNWGTDVLRKGFHDDIWIASLENQLNGESQSNFVISDARFPNEIKMIHNLGGEVWHVQRGPMPEWSNIKYDSWNDLSRYMTKYYPNIHASEWSWILGNFNHVIHNDTSLSDLYRKVDECL